MPSPSTTDRQSLCCFTFADARQCRAPRATSSNEGFCHYHARKQAQSQAVETLAQDLSFFFSGAHLTANDLATALSRLLPAVVRGHIKPRTARTIAYMAQTLLQTMRLSQLEYAAAFGDDAWRKAVRKAVTENFTHRLPKDLHVAPGLSPASPPLPHVNPASPPSPPVQTPPAPSEDSHVAPGLSPASSLLTSTPAATTPPAPPPPPRKPRPESPHRDPYAAQFEHVRIFQDGKPLDGLPI
jgi:hypothetical protein